jgi:hypothetical protein
MTNVIRTNWTAHQIQIMDISHYSTLHPGISENETIVDCIHLKGNTAILPISVRLLNGMHISELPGMSAATTMSFSAIIHT